MAADDEHLRALGTRNEHITGTPLDRCASRHEGFAVAQCRFDGFVEHVTGHLLCAIYR